MQTDVAAILVQSIPGIVAGYAGRQYFGGFGGALLGYGAYAVLVRPLLFPRDRGVPQQNLQPLPPA